MNALEDDNRRTLNRLRDLGALVEREVVRGDLSILPINQLAKLLISEVKIES